MIILKIIAILLAVLSIVGSIVPALPGPPLGWVAMLLAYICKGTDVAGNTMSLTLLLVWLAITVAVTIIDNVVPAMLTRATGGHKAASWGAVLGLVVGIFFSPVGMIGGCLLGAFLGELLIADSGVWKSFKASLGAFLGFLCGMVLKLLCSAVMCWYAVIYLW